MMHMLEPLEVAFTPCPNDTFLFYGWAHEKIEKKLPIMPLLADVQQLNQWAKERRYPLSKVSMGCLGKILDSYCLLPVGCALGRGGGPKIIAKERLALEDLKHRVMAIPGQDTTAYLLLSALIPSLPTPLFCTYDQILPLLKKGKADCGLIIHETRFTFEQEGFHEVADLGLLWEERYRLPLPLGGIVAQRKLGYSFIDYLSNVLQESLAFAWKHPAECLPYMLTHSQEKEPALVQKHVDLYVTQETFSLSGEGIKAIETLLEMGRKKGLLSKEKKAFLSPLCV